MALRRKPHTFTHIPVTTSKTGGRVDVPTEGTPRSFKCQITPSTTEAVIRQFGDIEVHRPHLMLCEIEDGQQIKAGHRGLFNGREFFVKADPMLFEAGDATDHAQVLLDQKQYT